MPGLMSQRKLLVELGLGPGTLDSQTRAGPWFISWILCISLAFVRLRFFIYRKMETHNDFSDFSSSQLVKALDLVVALG